MKIQRIAEILNTWSMGSGALHQRLTLAVQEAIRQGNLFPGMRLPAERELAKILAVSRTTVVTSYNDLRSTGWIQSKTGSGTWVSRSHASVVRAVAHGQIVSRSPLLNMLQASESGAIDLATTTTEPLVDLVRPALESARSHIDSLLFEREHQPFGMPPLREAIARYYTHNETPTTSDQILVTTGGQQAISLICSLFLQRGDHVLVESPTYFGVLESLKLIGARATPLNIEREHVTPQALLQRIAITGPRLVYLTPTAQNPTGLTMSESSRDAIAKDSLRHGVMIVEDEILADMTFGRRRPRPLASFAQSDNILTIGSLSKLMWTGLRVGWIRGSKAVIARLARLKTAADLCSPQLTQSVAVELMESVRDARAIRQIELSTKKKEAAALLRSILPGFTFKEPQAGLCLWGRIPGVDSRSLAQVALRHGVVLSHGNLFSVDESHGEYLRLPFVLDASQLRVGIERLALAHAEITCAGAPMRYISLAAV